MNPRQHPKHDQAATLAWGGPSYLGAMLAHYLDALYLFYVEALLLNLILVKRTA
jgi:hypothetical protein